MSNQLLGVALLAIISAIVGAVVAILLSGSQDDAGPSSQVSVVATVQGTTPEQKSEPAPLATPSTTAEQSDRAEQPATVPETQTPTAESQDAELEPSGPPAVQEQSEQDQPEQDQPEQDQLERQTSPQAQTEAASDEPPPPLETVSLFPDLIRQGESFSLTVESQEAGTVVATIGGRSWNLQQISDLDWWGVIAVPRDASEGVTQVVIDLYADNGIWLRMVPASVLVLTSPAPVEEIVLGGSGVAATPAQIQRGHDVRFVEHVDVTGPPRWSEPWILPVEGEVTGVFGAFRTYDGAPSDGWHHGHDIAADHGDRIVAPAPGVVAWTGDLVFHGTGVIVDHGAGVYSGYWHMSQIAVRAGDEVATGDWLGNIGSTGLSTGPHLHWEVIVQGIDVDPVQWTEADQFALHPPPAQRPDDQTDSTDTLG